jgi:hypothetical protein
VVLNAIALTHPWIFFLDVLYELKLGDGFRTYVVSVHVLFISWEKIAIVLFRPKRQIPKHREVNLT